MALRSLSPPAAASAQNVCTANFAALYLHSGHLIFPMAYTPIKSLNLDSGQSSQISNSSSLVFPLAALVYLQ